MFFIKEPKYIFLYSNLSFKKRHLLLKLLSSLIYYLYIQIPIELYSIMYLKTKILLKNTLLHRNFILILLLPPFLPLTLLLIIFPFLFLFLPALLLFIQCHWKIHIPPKNLKMHLRLHPHISILIRCLHVQIQILNL